MKSERRPAAKQSQQQGRTAVAVPPPDGVAGLWVRYGNTALTVLLLVLAVYLFVRWRTRTAAEARNGLAEQAAQAAEAVRRVQPGFLFRSDRSKSDWIADTVKAEQAAAAKVTDLVNAAADDGRTRAAALLLRGDLNWNLANLPPLPGAATDPALRLPDPPDVLLKRAADAYAEALTAAPDEPAVTGPARLGLAAVAENRGDWAEARKQLDAVAGDENALAVLVDRAKAEIAGLSALQRPLYLDVPPPTTAPTTGPTTLPATLPATLPSTTAVIPMPIPAPIAVPISVRTPPVPVTPATGPTTRP